MLIKNLLEVRTDIYYESWNTVEYLQSNYLRTQFRGNELTEKLELSNQNLNYDKRIIKFYTLFLLND